MGPSSGPSSRMESPSGLDSDSQVHPTFKTCMSDGPGSLSDLSEIESLTVMSPRSERHRPPLAGPQEEGTGTDGSLMKPEGSLVHNEAFAENDDAVPAESPSSSKSTFRAFKGRLPRVRTAASWTTATHNDSGFDATATDPSDLGLVARRHAPHDPEELLPGEYSTEPSACSHFSPFVGEPKIPARMDPPALSPGSTSVPKRVKAGMQQGLPLAAGPPAQGAPAAAQRLNSLESMHALTSRSGVSESYHGGTPQRTASGPASDGSSFLAGHPLHKSGLSASSSTAAGLKSPQLTGSSFMATGDGGQPWPAILTSPAMAPREALEQQYEALKKQLHVLEEHLRPPAVACGPVDSVMLGGPSQCEPADTAADTAAGGTNSAALRSPMRSSSSQLALLAHAPGAQGVVAGQVLPMAGVPAPMPLPAMYMPQQQQPGIPVAQVCAFCGAASGALEHSNQALLHPSGKLPPIRTNSGSIRTKGSSKSRKIKGTPGAVATCSRPKSCKSIKSSRSVKSAVSSVAGAGSVSQQAVGSAKGESAQRADDEFSVQLVQTAGEASKQPTPRAGGATGDVNGASSRKTLQKASSKSLKPSRPGEGASAATARAVTVVDAEHHAVPAHGCLGQFWGRNREVKKKKLMPRAPVITAPVIEKEKGRGFGMKLGCL